MYSNLLFSVYGTHFGTEIDDLRYVHNGLHFTNSFDTRWTGAMHTPSLKLINAHYQASYGQCINLQHLNEVFDNRGKLHRGRPYMLSCRMKMKRVLFFPNGTIQILGGGLNPSTLQLLSMEISRLLHQYDSTRRPLLLRWKLNNMVFHFDMTTRIKLTKCVCTKHLSYEPELFPAALISKWQPAHVTLFPNGKGMITGIKSYDESLSILRQLFTFIQLHIS